MERDNIIDKNLENIKQGLIKELNLDLDIDVLANIVNSQFKMAKLAIENKVPIKFNYLGKFKIKDGREDAIATTNELTEAVHLSEDKKKSIKLAREIAFRQNKKQFKITIN